jgi:bacterioferritin-associated ferredoxin
MYVCLCKAVTDRVVRSLIRSGADTRAEIAERCGAGTDCGGCRGQIDEMLEEEREARGCASCPSAPAAAASSAGSSVFAPAPPAA